jgi:hypothetical protein
LRDMLGEDRRGVSNVLAFLNGLWLAKAIWLTRFYVLLAL